MAKKQFKTESKKLMDLMINSIYTNKDIFLREIISNASDAIDKLYYKSLTDRKIKVNKDDLCINISIDEDAKTITISDNGIGMTKDELENNLGTIAKSGSEVFKAENEHKEDIDIIGRFGVGFYSAFMVAKNIKVISKAYGEDKAYTWESSGIDGYTINDGEREEVGTDIIITLKDDEEDFNYSEYLHDHKIKELIKKYSDYITYPIKMNDEVLNSMVPIWKKTNVSDEDYNAYYMDKFVDYNEPIMHIKSSIEGKVNYRSLIFIPSKAAPDFYTKDYEKGLQLYSNGVLIMDKCKELVPDYYSFIKGIVDSEDLSLNISRETLQQDSVVQTIAKSLDTKITKELESFLNDNREKYEEFFKEFGMNLKFGCYNNWGMDKEKLQDLLLFTSSKDKKLVTLKEISERSNDKIYYVCGETIDKIDNLPIVDNYKDKDIEILYCDNYLDEFVMQTLHTYDGKELINIQKEETDLSTDAEKEELKKYNEDNKSMLDIMKASISDISDVKFTNRLGKHPVGLSSVGDITIEMEKIINAMPTDQSVSAVKVLEINKEHPIADKLIKLEKDNNKEELEKLSKVLYAQARLIEGLPIDNPTEITNLICEELSK
ncbi:MAG: molecular chaperone HtpG [Bacilli bacterium]|nr:molecular chaperone HtpG [Bacilli bacterium]